MPAENLRVAGWLREASQLLQAQGASPYRVSAYRNAADALAHFPRDVRFVFETEGVRGLDDIPKVGLGIASAIAEMLLTGQWSLLDRLRGSTEPETLLRSVPGVGPALARRIHETLHIDTLEGLEVAANDGRLEKVPGVGARRAAAWRATVAAMLGRFRRDASSGLAAHEAPVEVILDVDREYREKARAGQLRRIAPRRFNPGNETWLAVLHTRRGPWHFTALNSNSALAHRLDRVRDWVVVCYYDSDHVERQCTVVTEAGGILAGRRVVRGREADCRSHYLAQPETSDET